MEALVPAFVAALLGQACDRSAWLTAILADRYGRPASVAIAAILAHAAGNALAAGAGALVAGMLNPNARALMLALALVFAGGGALMPSRMPDRLDRWGLGPLLTPLLGIFILALGDSTQFFTLAFAVRGPDPWMAGIGATLGAAVIGVTAALLGEAGWRALPLKPVRLTAGLLFLVTGAIVALGALRLI